ncbi:MAG: ribonuclease P protein component [Candidatus Pacebacteria bacterium]|nr:ribonuclease P protein component [Candidatus Paceibacterota bacterium]
MLPRTHRINTDECNNILTKGVSVYTPFFSLRFIKYAHTEPFSSSFGVVVSKKVAKTAVERNRLKRRSREIIRSFLSKIQPNFKVMVFVSAAAKKLKKDQFLEELRVVLVKAGILMP